MIITEKLSISEIISLSENFDKVDDIIKNNIDRSNKNELILPQNSIFEITEIISSNSLTKKISINEKSALKILMILEKEDSIISSSEITKIIKNSNHKHISHREDFRRLLNKILINKTIINEHIAQLSLNYLKKKNISLNIIKLLKEITVIFIRNKLKEKEYNNNYNNKIDIKILLSMYFNINSFEILKFFIFYLILDLTKTPAFKQNQHIYEYFKILVNKSNVPSINILKRNVEEIIEQEEKLKMAKENYENKQNNLIKIETEYNNLNETLEILKKEKEITYKKFNFFDSNIKKCKSNLYKLSKINNQNNEKVQKQIILQEKSLRKFIQLETKLYTEYDKIKEQLENKNNESNFSKYLLEEEEQSLIFIKERIIKLENNIFKLEKSLSLYLRRIIKSLLEL